MRKLALVFVFFLVSNSASAEFARSTTFDDRDTCIKDKGAWREFGDSSADSCEAKMDHFSIATQVISYSCDCGKNRCWNGDHCVNLEEYKKFYDLQKSAEKKKKQQEQKSRSKEYRDLSNQRLGKLIIEATNRGGGAQDNDGKKGQQSASYGNNMSQFKDKLPKDLSPQQPQTDLSSQKTIQDQGSEIAKQVEQGPIGKVFSLPKNNATDTVTGAPANPATNSSSATESSDSVSGPTPFFLQQQEKAKKEAEAAAASANTSTSTTANSNSSTTSSTAATATSNSSTNTSTGDTSIPSLPQIPLPQ